MQNLLQEDRFLVLADYAAYLTAQEEVDRLYHEPESWARKAMLNTARMGKFSIDRTVGEYAGQIWDASPYCITPP